MAVILPSDNQNKRKDLKRKRQHAREILYNKIKTNTVNTDEIFMEEIKQNESSKNHRSGPITPWDNKESDNLVQNVSLSLVDYITNTNEIDYIPDNQISLYQLHMIIEHYKDKMQTNLKMFEKELNENKNIHKTYFKDFFVTHNLKKSLERLSSIEVITNGNDITTIKLNCGGKYNDTTYLINYEEETDSIIIGTINDNIELKNFHKISSSLKFQPFNSKVLQEIAYHFLMFNKSISKQLELPFHIEANLSMHFPSFKITLLHELLNSNLSHTINDGLFVTYAYSTNNGNTTIYSKLNKNLDFDYGIETNENLKKTYITDPEFRELAKRTKVSIDKLPSLFQTLIKEEYEKDELVIENQYQNYDEIPVELQTQMFYINTANPSNLNEYIKQQEVELQEPTNLINELIQDINSTNNNEVTDIEYQTNKDEETTFSLVTNKEDIILTEEQQNKLNLINTNLQKISSKYDIPIKNGKINIDEFRKFYDDKIEQLDNEINKAIEIDEKFNANHPNSADHYLELSKQTIINKTSQKASLSLEQNKITDDYQQPIFKVENGFYNIEGSLTTNLSIVTNISINEEILLSCRNFIARKSINNYIKTNSNEILNHTPITSIKITRGNQYTK